MKTNSDKKENRGTDLRSELEAAGLREPPVAAQLDWDRLAWYTHFLRTNDDFFSASDRGRILERHLYESLCLVSLCVERGLVSRETAVLDAGSGPGLPGFLFACLKPTPEVTLLDSSRRRLGRLEAAWQAEHAAVDPAPAAGPAAAAPGAPSRLHFEYARLEEQRRERFDLVSIRALIPFPFCVELVAGAVRLGGSVVFAATGSEPSERDRAHLGQLGFVSRETVQPPELAFLGERRFYLLLKKRRTPHPYPRSWKVIRAASEQWAK